MKSLTFTAPAEVRYIGGCKYLMEPDRLNGKTLYAFAPGDILYIRTDSDHGDGLYDFFYFDEDGDEIYISLADYEIDPFFGKKDLLTFYLIYGVPEE